LFVFAVRNETRANELLLLLLFYIIVVVIIIIFALVRVYRARTSKQKRCPNLVRRVDLGALSEQHFHHSVMAVRGGDVQTRFAIEVSAVQQVGRSGQQ
jgi:hypothetical protein